jgi:acyl-CoA thioesterase FadM
MSNARFLRELDFAIADLFARTSLTDIVATKGGKVLKKDQSIRYRRFIPLFRCFDIETKVVCWNEESIFMEHKFLDIDSKFVYAVAMSWCRVENCSLELIMEEWWSKCRQEFTKPDVPEKV